MVVFIVYGFFDLPNMSARVIREFQIAGTVRPADLELQHGGQF